jgi:hypothetical protein
MHEMIVPMGYVIILDARVCNIAGALPTFDQQVIPRDVKSQNRNRKFYAGLNMVSSSGVVIGLSLPTYCT